MPTFTPPLVSNGSLGDGSTPGTPSERFWRFYPAQPRGVNIFKYDDGTYAQTDAYPHIIDGVGKTVVTAYTGGHSYTVTASEAAALTAAGFGAYLT